MSELPSNWMAASVLEVSELVRGVTYTKADASDVAFDGSIPVLRANNIQERTFDLSDLIHVPSSVVSDTQRIMKGDVVVATSSGSISVVGKAAQAEHDTNAGFGAFCGLLRPSNIIDARYFGHYFSSHAYRTAVSAMARGVNINNLKRDHFQALELPLAPLNEQTRIADKLDAVLARIDACRDRLDRIPAILKRLRLSVLAAAFTGRLTEEFRSAKSLTPVDVALSKVETPPRPNRYSSRTDAVIDGDYGLAVGNPERDLPEGWKWVALVDIARMESGHTPSRSHTEYWEGGDIPWIGIADARDGHGKTITDTYQHTNALGLANSAARLLPSGTVCLSRTASVGYVVRMGTDMATSQDFANWTCTSAINPDWLMYLFVAETDALYRFGKGSTHTTVYFPELMAFHVSLPPIEEQTEIVRRVEALFAFVDRLEARYNAARAQVERLTPSLLAKAFRGELVPQDPNDEPASTLLARIRAQRESTTAGQAQRGRGRKAAVS